MEQDTIINHLNHYGIKVDPSDNCKIYAPIGTIMKVNGQYIRCTLSKHTNIDCSRCVGRYPIGHTSDICNTLLCGKDEREDDTEVFFEVIDTDERRRKEGNA